MTDLKRRPDLLPSAAVALSAAAWGVFWIPLRALDEAGLEGGWATLSFYILSTLVLLPVAIVRWRRLWKAGFGLILTGLCTGGAWALYINALLHTEVVRALLLFYLTPLWSTLLARAILKEPITSRRIFTIALGLAGLAVILGFEGGVPLPRNAGDWMGLLGGVVWAYASVRLRSDEETEAFEVTFGFFAFGGLVALAMMFLPIERAAALPSFEIVAQIFPWLLALIVLFTIPANFLLLWAAGRISPGRVGILLMAELVTGTVSAAILTDEPFGLREIAGALLITGAGAAEMLRRQPEPTTTGVQT